MADESPSPVYLANRREWNERYGVHVTAARHWRWISLGLLAATMVSTGCAVWMASQAHVVPYVVEVDKLGEPQAVRRLEAASPVDPSMVKSQLARWITDIRTVYADPIAEKNIAVEAYGWVDRSSPALEQLNDWFRANNPMERASKVLVGVTIDSVGPIGPDTWGIDWSEDHRSTDGSSSSKSYWRASVRIRIVPPTDDSTVLANPLGIYVEWFNVSPRIH